MLDTLFHNPNHQAQVRIPGGALILSQDLNDPAAWAIGSNLQNPLHNSNTKLNITSSQSGLLIEIDPSVKLSTVRGLDFSQNSSLTEALLPLRFSIGETDFLISDVAQTIRENYRDLEPLQLEKKDSTSLQENASPKKTYAGPSPSTIIRWLESLGKLHEQTACSHAFYKDAAQFIIKTAELDGAAFATLDAQGWDIHYSQAATPELRSLCRLDYLDKLLESPQTYYHRIQIAPQADTSTDPQTATLSGSAKDLFDTAVVVSPILDTEKKLVGAVFGYRKLHQKNRRRGIRYLEAYLVDLLAKSVAIANLRLKKEADSARQRVLLEQAFSPEVARKIEQNPNALAPIEREITMLFADMRGFSTLCQNLSTQQIYPLLKEVMDALTEVIMEHQGIVIDYYGDGLFAMWNAPVAEPAHAELACRTAVLMNKQLQKISEKWLPITRRELTLAIGIHTGIAQVGNSGSTQRIKYGPRGQAVNLAARTELAAKQMDLPLVLTQATREKIPASMTTYRACTANLPGIKMPVELFGLCLQPKEQDLLTRLELYSQTLEYFEAGDLDAALHLIHNRKLSGSAMPTEFLTREIKKRRSHKETLPTSQMKSHALIQITK